VSWPAGPLALLRVECMLCVCARAARPRPPGRLVRRGVWCGFALMCVARRYAINWDLLYNWKEREVAHPFPALHSITGPDGVSACSTCSAPRVLHGHAVVCFLLSSLPGHERRE